MAKIEEIERRLQNWSRWRLTRGAGPLGFAAVSLGDPTVGVRTPFEEAPIPTNAIEAGETDDAVRVLPSEIRRTVEVYYVEGRSERHRLALLCVGKATMHERIDRAHRLLSSNFAAKNDRAKQERTRVESLHQGRIR